MELEEELKVVGNSLKSLEVSEEKVTSQNKKISLKLMTLFLGQSTSGRVQASDQTTYCKIKGGKNSSF